MEGRYNDSELQEKMKKYESVMRDRIQLITVEGFRFNEIVKKISNAYKQLCENWDENFTYEFSQVELKSMNKYSSQDNLKYSWDHIFKISTDIVIKINKIMISDVTLKFDIDQMTNYISKATLEKKNKSGFLPDVIEWLSWNLFSKGLLFIVPYEGDKQSVLLDNIEDSIFGSGDTSSIISYLYEISDKIWIWISSKNISDSFNLKLVSLFDMDSLLNDPLSNPFQFINTTESYISEMNNEDWLFIGDYVFKMTNNIISFSFDNNSLLFWDENSCLWMQVIINDI